MVNGVDLRHNFRIKPQHLKFPIELKFHNNFHLVFVAGYNFCFPIFNAFRSRSVCFVKKEML